MPGRRGHGYLQVGVQRGPGQVEPGARRTLASSRVSTRSVCALPSNPPQACGDLVERVLAVVPERRVAEVVGEPGDVDHVRVAAEPGAHLAGDLGDLERVGQPGTQEVVADPAVCTWVLAASRRNAGRVQHPGPVALERGAAVAAVLGGLGSPALGVARPS